MTGPVRKKERVTGLTKRHAAADTTLGVAMTSERSHAYGRVTKMVDDLSASKLHASEQQIVRDAADAMFFCEDLSADVEARAALESLEQLIGGLLESERFTAETADRLREDIEGCGPALVGAAG
jgi:hypothetical protein